MAKTKKSIYNTIIVAPTRSEKSTSNALIPIILSYPNSNIMLNSKGGFRRKNRKTSSLKEAHNG
jgi:type IV secretory pathway TraG/TraD family ATPase VirD4